MADYIRKQRGIMQNIFLIESIIDETNKYEKCYVVMGSSGNVYQVTICNEPFCTCPDYVTRHKRCKHIFFVLVKIMKTDKEDQDEYTDTELLEMFVRIPQITNNLIVNDKVKQKYNTLKPNSDSKITKKNTDDLCPICLDDLENGDELDYCKFSCGKNIHKICFGMWSKSKGNKCVFCSSHWTKNDKYINLS